MTTNQGEEKSQADMEDSTLQSDSMDESSLTPGPASTESSNVLGLSGPGVLALNNEIPASTQDANTLSETSEDLSPETFESKMRMLDNEINHIREEISDHLERVAVLKERVSKFTQDLLTNLAADDATDDIQRISSQVDAESIVLQDLVWEQEKLCEQNLELIHKMCYAEKKVAKLLEDSKNPPLTQNVVSGAENSAEE